MISRDGWSPIFPDTYIAVKQKPGKNHNQENSPDLGIEPGPLDESQRCYPSFTAVIYVSHKFRFISFHFIHPCDGASDLVDRHPCYSETFIASHHSNRLYVGHDFKTFIYLFIGDEMMRKGRHRKLL